MYNYYYLTGCILILFVACTSLPEYECESCDFDDSVLLQYTSSVKDGVRALQKLQLLHGASRANAAIFYERSSVKQSLPMQLLQKPAGPAKLTNESQNKKVWKKPTQKKKSSSADHNSKTVSETKGSSVDANDGPVVSKDTEVKTVTKKVTHDANVKLPPGNKTVNGTAKEEQKEEMNPFVDVNRTTETREVHEKSHKVNATHNLTSRTVVTKTTTEVSMKTPISIVYVHLWFVLPLFLLWVAGQSYPDIAWLQRSILPITLCTLIIVQDLANQALVSITKSPVGITACQSLFCALVAGVWCVGVSKLDNVCSRQ